MSERGSISVTWTPCLGRWFRDLYWRPLDLLRSSLLRSPRRCQNPCEWTPRLGSAKPIAQRRPKGDLDAVPASWTIGSEGDGCAHPGSAAVGAIWITVLRASGAAGAPLTRRRILIPSIPQVLRLAAALDHFKPGLGDVAMVLAFTGLRWEEAEAVPVDNVDLNGQCMTVDRTASESGGRRDIRNDMKTRAAVRVVMIHGYTASHQDGMVKYTAHELRHVCASLLKVSRIASAASFGRSRERVLPAAQRAALGQARSNGSPRTLRDLGCHHPLVSGRTMMQQAQPKAQRRGQMPRPSVRRLGLFAGLEHCSLPVVTMTSPSRPSLTSSGTRARPSPTRSTVTN